MDMCGIVGIMGTSKASSELYNGLFAIQHRGQNGTGMFVADGKNTQLEKDRGLVDDVFDKKTLDNLEGKWKVSHYRFQCGAGCPTFQSRRADRDGNGP
ncbi:MAG: hypothetical protein V5A66_03660 [Candidatus Thermoplasmatota archaeon]